MTRTNTEGYLESIDPLLLQPYYPVSSAGTMLGRDAEDCQVILSRDFVSRRHCALEPSESGIVLVDLGAMNGTFVNGVRVKRHPLQEGDRIGLGRPAPHHFVYTAQRPTSRRQFILSPQPVYRIGRSPQNDLPLPSDPTVSHLHARLRVNGTAILIEDAGSANGTFVNGVVVRTQTVGPHDVVRIGSCEITFAPSSDGLAVTVRERRNQVRLQAQNLTRVHNGRELLKQINLVIQPGEYVGVLGPSGAGKSTLLNALNGFNPANRGDVLLNGTSLYKSYDMFRNSIGYVPQDDIIHRELTVERSLLYTARLRLPRDTTNEQLQQHVTSVIETLGLTHVRNNPVERLSGGQRKRVSIGCELLTRPSLIFLDEPTSGLDPSTEEKLMKHFRQMSEQGQTVVLTTHILYNLQLLDLVVLLARGRLVYFGPVSEVCPFFSSPEYPITRPIEVFDLLEPETTDPMLREKRAEEFEAKYKQSPLYQKYIVDRMPGTSSASSPGSLGNAGAAKPSRIRRVRAYMQAIFDPRQFVVLVRRMFDLKLSFPGRLAIPMLTPVILALLTATMVIGNQQQLDGEREKFERDNAAALDAMNAVPPSFMPAGQPPPEPLLSKEEFLQLKFEGFQGMAVPLSFPLTLVMTAVFLGTLSACLEISGERSIYMRERAVNLSIPTYIASKLPSLFLLSALQCFVYVFMSALLLRLTSVNVLALVAISVGVAWVSAVIGIFISSLDPTPGQNSVVLAVIAVLPQMIFSGSMGPSFYGGMGMVTQRLADILPARWGFELMLTAIYQEPAWASRIITGAVDDGGMGFRFGNDVYQYNALALAGLAAAYFLATCFSLKRYDRL